MAIKSRASTAWLLFFSTALLTTSALAMQTAADLVERMPLLAKQLNYSGVFSYEAADIQRSVRVSHQVVDGVAYRRISYLDGAAKDQLHESAANDCNGTYVGGPQPRDYYRFEVLGNYRVAGRNALKIQVLPIDNLRYGHLYGIDQQTGLMLQSILISQSGRPLENLKYIDITIDKNAQPQPASEDQPVTQSECSYERADSHFQAQQWQVDWMPPGFVRVDENVLEEGKVSLVYSDGISVFSVLIDAAPDSKYPELVARVGPTQMVVTNYTHNNTDYQIVVSAEMPRVTVNQIALSVRPPTEQEKLSNDS